MHVERCFFYMGSLAMSSLLISENLDARYQLRTHCPLGYQITHFNLSFWNNRASMCTTVLNNTVHISSQGMLNKPEGS